MTKAKLFLARYAHQIIFILWIFGTAGSFLFPFEPLGVPTFQSENALLIGLASSEITRQEIRDSAHFLSEISNLTCLEMKSRIKEMFDLLNLEHDEQHFEFYSATGKNLSGSNLYAVLRAPRADGSESMILSAPLENRYKQVNSFGISTALMLIKSFKKRTYWARDIVLVFPEHAEYGAMFFMHAHHSLEVPRKMLQDIDWFRRDDLKFHVGSLQTGINLEFGSSSHYEKFAILAEGTNGQLPNMDVIHIITKLCNQRNIPLTLDTSPAPQYEHKCKYLRDLSGLFQMMKTQALGTPNGVHGVLIRYRIESATIFGISSDYSSPRKQYSFAEVLSIVEGSFRSLNNLLERLHHSLFYYLLISPTKYVSIAVYFVPFVLIALCFIIKALWLWYVCGDRFLELEALEKVMQASRRNSSVVSRTTTSSSEWDKYEKSYPAFSVRKRDIWSPIVVILLSFAFGLAIYALPWVLSSYSNVLTDSNDSSLNFVSLVGCIVLFIIGSLLCSFTFRFLTTRVSKDELSLESTWTEPAPTQLLLHCYLLLITCAIFASVAILNFSLSYFILVVGSPAYLMLTGTVGLKTSASNTEVETTEHDESRKNTITDEGGSRRSSQKNISKQGFRSNWFKASKEPRVKFVNPCLHRALLPRLTLIVLIILLGSPISMLLFRIISQSTIWTSDFNFSYKNLISNVGNPGDISEYYATSIIRGIMECVSTFGNMLSEFSKGSTGIFKKELKLDNHILINQILHSSIISDIFPDILDDSVVLGRWTWYLISLGWCPVSMVALVIILNSQKL